MILRGRLIPLFIILQESKGKESQEGWVRQAYKSIGKYPKDQRAERDYSSSIGSCLYCFLSFFFFFSFFFLFLPLCGFASLTRRLVDRSIGLESKEREASMGKLESSHSGFMKKGMGTQWIR